MCTPFSLVAILVLFFLCAISLSANSLNVQLAHIYQTFHVTFTKLLTHIQLAEMADAQAPALSLVVSYLSAPQDIGSLMLASRFLQHGTPVVWCSWLYSSPNTCYRFNLLLSFCAVHDCRKVFFLVMALPGPLMASAQNQISVNAHLMVPSKPGLLKAEAPRFHWPWLFTLIRRLQSAQEAPEDTEDLASKLMESKAFVDGQRSLVKTLLHAGRMNADLLTALLEQETGWKHKHLDPCVLGAPYLLTLHQAVLTGQPELVAVLLNKGADAEALVAAQPSTHYRRDGEKHRLQGQCAGQAKASNIHMHGQHGE